MAGSNFQQALPQIVGIGESLFDVFADRTVLGGAPLNFAVHAHALLNPSGLSATIASRVGDDELGRRVLHELGDRGLRLDWLQIDPVHPTGRSIVTIDPTGEPHYEIVRDVAWDFLTFDGSLAHLTSHAPVVCFNTLAQRHPVSRHTIQRTIEASMGVKLFDVNIRQDFYDRLLIESGLRAATHAKLNRDEMQLVSKLFHLDGADTDQGLCQSARSLIEKFNLKMVAVTRGEEGTILFTDDGATTEGERVRYEPHPHADTVGAGDACNAGLAIGLLLGWDSRRMVSLANHCGAFVASQPGATPRLPPELLRQLGL